MFPLEAALHKMTGFPAERFGLVGRGRVAPGFAADLTVFDAEQIADMATFDAPKQAPKGISHVMVNGRMAVVGGEVVDWHAGQVLRRGQ
ncbi:D-aminoacylase [compost metagenome]